MVLAEKWWCSAAGKVTAGLVESNGNLLPGGWGEAGWLPVHRNQLRAQRLVTSIGSLYLFIVQYRFHDSTAVCYLFVCYQDNKKCYGRIFVNFIKSTLAVIEHWWKFTFSWRVCAVVKYAENPLIKSMRQSPNFALPQLPIPWTNLDAVSNILITKSNQGVDKIQCYTVFLLLSPRQGRGILWSVNLYVCEHRPTEKPQDQTSNHFKN